MKYEKGKTIGRNQRKKAEIIFKNAFNIKVYTLDNGFNDRSADKIGWDGKSWMLKNWNDFNFAKLIEYSNNQYGLDIHSNYWVKFESKISIKREAK